MKASLRRKRAVRRDRRRGFATWELTDRYGPQHDDDGWLLPLSGFQMYLTSGYVNTAMRVIGLQDRAAQLFVTELGMAHVAAFMGRPYRMSVLARAMLPREHEVRIEGRRAGDGRMMFLAGDPDRPSAVYAERVARRVGAG